MLRAGTVSTNAFLRKVHNFAVDMNWLPATVIPRRQWPAIHYKEKRAITFEEHQKIIAAEVNPERKTLYQLCWHLGREPGRHRELEGRGRGLDEWHGELCPEKNRRAGAGASGRRGVEFVQRPARPKARCFRILSRVRAGDRATEFASRCRQLGIVGVTLHSYRYAWAERAKTVGYPERFAQEALGHNSKAVHRAYAKRALMKIPSLEDYEREAAINSKSAF